MRVGLPIKFDHVFLTARRHHVRKERNKRRKGEKNIFPDVNDDRKYTVHTHIQVCIHCNGCRFFRLVYVFNSVLSRFQVLWSWHILPLVRHLLYQYLYIYIYYSFSMCVYIYVDKYAKRQNSTLQFITGLGENTHMERFIQIFFKQ